MKKLDDINVGLIGAGAQGRLLLGSCLKAIDGLRFKAVCDIWPRNRRQSADLVNAYNRGGEKVAEFADCDQMLNDSDKLDLDAVIVATPDWMHAPDAIACMNAGMHVYCEKEMSNSLETARQMVQVSRKTQKLLQIGRQRRSNPRYINAVNKIMRKYKILGRIMQANAQWNRSIREDIGWRPKDAMSPATLAKYGYDTMRNFRNWRWSRRHGGGPIVDLGAHQIDIFNWVFGTPPKSVVASGGVDYYKNRQWYDNVMCVFEYETDEGVARAAYRASAASGYGGFHEAFMGEYGTLVISEAPRFGNRVISEPHPERSLNGLVKAGLLKAMHPRFICRHRGILDIRCDPSDHPQRWSLRTELNEPPHRVHLRNFFDAIRGKARLTCPGEIGYRTAAAVLSINQAVRSQKKIEFTKEHFEVGSA